MVEDEKDLLFLVRDSLTREGHSVMIAEDGLQALEILKQQEIELGIFDVMMPRMDGFQLLTEIRKESDMPVIFLTARTDEIDRIYGLSLGADDYLVKPFSMAELKARVNIQYRHLQKCIASKQQCVRNMESPQQLICGDLKLDLKEAVLYKKDHADLQRWNSGTNRRSFFVEAGYHVNAGTC